jgi:hypothetical protein
MNRNVLIGGGAAVVVAAAAALIYFFALGGAGTGPGTDNTALAQERAAIFWKGAKQVPGAVLKAGTATTGSGKESLVMRNYELTVDTSKMGGKAGKITVRFGEINIRKFDWAAQKAGKSAKWADLSFSNITVPKETLPMEAQMGLTMVGIAEVNIGGTYIYSFDPKKRTLDVGKVVLELKKLASVTLQGKMMNFDIEAMARAQGTDPKKRAQAMQTALSGASIGKVKLVLVNKGLAEKLLKTFATFRGGNVEKFKASLVKQMEAALKRAPHQLAKDALTAVVAFIKKPKTLIVEAAPDAPVPFSLLFGASPDQIREKLKLRFVAK